MTPVVIAIGEEEALTLDECRQHLNVVPIAVDSEDNATHPDDDLIMAMQGAAREYCENFLGLSLTRRTLEVALDSFPLSTDPGGLGIELPMGPVLEIDQLSSGVVSSDADSDIVPIDDYVLNTYVVPALLLPVSSWRSITASTNAVKVRYQAGYGVDSDGGYPLPKAIRAAMLLILGHLYRNRESSTDAAMINIPLGVEALLRPLRVRLGMA